MPRAKSCRVETERPQLQIISVTVAWNVQPDMSPRLKVKQKTEKKGHVIREPHLRSVL